MLSIQLSGHESPGILRAVLAAVRAYAAEATEAYIENEGRRATEYGYVSAGEQSATNQEADMFKQTAAEVAPAAAEAKEVASEVVAAEKPRRTRRAPAAEEVKPVVQESAETATADQSAVIAEARAEMPAVMQEDTLKVKVEDIRAVAKKFNTDELRAVAMAILTNHAAASVTALADRDDIIRLSALRAFEAAALAHNLA